MEDQIPNKLWLRLQMIVALLLVCFPIGYLGVVYFMSTYGQVEGAPPKALLYVLYAVALASPATSYILKSAYISKMRTSTPTGEFVFKRYYALVFMRSAKIGATYIYGLLWFFLSGETTPLYYFYFIGIVWSILQWPWKQEYLEFAQEVEAP